MSARDEVFEEALLLPDEERYQLLRELALSLGYEVPDQDAPERERQEWRAAVGTRLAESRRARSSRPR
jgi:hypothetical protein